MAIHCSTMNYDFKESMTYALAYGGDTDTNCAIVGGLISCKKDIIIPENYIKKINNAHINKFYKKRGHKWLLPYYTL